MQDADGSDEAALSEGMPLHRVGSPEGPNAKSLQAEAGPLSSLPVAGFANLA